MTTARLPAAFTCDIRSWYSGRRAEANRTIEERYASTERSRRSRSAHCAATRKSSSLARTFAMPARKIAWLSARIILFIVLPCASCRFNSQSLPAGILAIDHRPAVVVHCSVLRHLQYVSLPDRGEGV